MGAWKRYEPQALNDEVLIFYGYGGGGGGPYLDAAKGRFPVWDGELYLQFHRGTLTSVARTKANNRQAERALREVEYLSAMAMRAGVDYPGEQMVRLTLLRGPVFPDPEADIGQHSFRFALRLHDGISDPAQVVRAAERFNNPIAVFGDASQGAPSADMSFSFADVDCDNVTLETVKKAEDSDELILRIFEHANRRAKATVRFGLPIGSVHMVNLMEEGAVPIAVENDAVVLKLRLFEIVTLRIKLSLH